MKAKILNSSVKDGKIIMINVAESDLKQAVEMLQRAGFEVDEAYKHRHDI